MQMVEEEIEIGLLFKALEQYEKIKFSVGNPELLNSPLEIQDVNGEWTKIYAAITKTDIGIKLTMSNGETIHAAAQHRIRIKDNNCYFLKDLNVGDKIEKSDGSYQTIVAIDQTDQSVFYDLSLDNDNHLYQTANGYVHHNTLVFKSLAWALFDDESALTRFDMSEYMEKHAVAKLIGAPPGYEGYERGGILTNAMRSNPHRVILFDEIEKADPAVFDIFLQILSDGRLTDNMGRTVDFSESYIGMTTNIGQKYFLDPNLTSEEAEHLANEELNTVYRSEFLNRFNGRENIFCFKRLDDLSVQKIVRREINQLNRAYEDDNIVTLLDDKSLVDFSREQYNPARGARGITGYINANVKPLLANTVLDNPEFKGELILHYDGASETFHPQFAPA